jgi:hypothetical protein
MLGTLGRRETVGDERSQLDERERPVVRRQVRKVVVQSVLIAVVLTALAYAV